MIGITSYGAYIPYFRLGEGTVGFGSRTERAVASFDEDSVTMAVSAADDCLKGLDRFAVDSLYLATTTAPYLEKQGASIVAAAADLRTDIVSSDLGNSLRAGTLALRTALDSVKAGSAKNALVVASDMRVPQAKSEFDSVFGDGAAALAVGSENVIAKVLDVYSVSNDILDIYRSSGDAFVRTSESRFTADKGYLITLPEAINTVLERNKLSKQDISKAVFYGHNARTHKEMSGKLGFDPKTQVQDMLFGTVGNTGAASTIMGLVAALESAKPGDKILVASYSDGADVFLLEVTEAINSLPVRNGISGCMKSKRVIKDYLTYCKWRGLIDMAAPLKRPPLDEPSAAAILREHSQNIRFYGVECNSCGTRQYPMQRVCTRCKSKDDFTPVRFADKEATLFTYSNDTLGPTLDPPLVVSIIDFEGGGRTQLLMTDRDVAEVQIGMRLKMSFRKLHVVAGINNYFWKCVPVRD